MNEKILMIYVMVISILYLFTLTVLVWLYLRKKTRELEDFVDQLSKHVTDEVSNTIDTNNKYIVDEVNKMHHLTLDNVNEIIEIGREEIINQVENLLEDKEIYKENKYIN